MLLSKRYLERLQEKEVSIATQIRMKYLILLLHFMNFIYRLIGELASLLSCSLIARLDGISNFLRQKRAMLIER